MVEARAHSLALGQMWVVPTASKGSERDVLGALARSVSGRLVERKDEYAIEFDPRAFRLRAQAWVAAHPPRNPSNRLAAAS